MNKQIQVFLLLLSIFIVNTIKAQNAKVDSLENVLNSHHTEDTSKVNLLNEIAHEICGNDLNKTLNYAIQAGELSDRLKFLKGKAESTWLIGITYFKSDKLVSLDYFHKALKIAESINYRHGIAKYSNSIGMNHRGRAEKEKALEYLQKAVKISEELNDRLGVAKYLNDLSSFYSAQGNHELGIAGLQKSLKILTELGDKPTLAQCLNNFGTIYYNQGNYPVALDYYLKSLKIKEELQDKSGVLVGLINLSAIYRWQNDYEKSLEVLLRTLKIAEELNDKQWLPICLEKIGITYLYMHNSLALEYFHKALKMGEQLGDKYKIMNATEGIADFYLQQKNYKKALEEYEKALEKAEEVQRKPSISDIYRKMGTVYFKLREYDKALIYTQKSLPIAIEFKMLKNQNKIHYQLSQIDSANNNFRQAYANYKLYKLLSDSIYNEKNVKKIAELEYSYKFEKEKQTIELEQQKKDALQTAEKKQQKTIIFSLTTAFMLMCLLAFFLYRSYIFKHKTNLLLTKQKHEIEELIEEYQVVNEELVSSNEELIITKNLVEESEERLRLLIKNSNDILVLVNEKGEQFFISDAAKNITGYSIDELLGTLEEVIYPDDIVIVQQHWEKVVANKNVADSIQYRHKHKENGYVWFEAVAQNFLDHPAIKAVVANVRDITERKKAEHALQESEAEKARLMALEIEIIGRELESNQKSVTAATLKLIQNAERDTQTIERLVEIENNTNSTGKQKINTLISDYKRISYNSNWDEFEIFFEKVHRSFYEQLNSQFPTLTANERKICAFLKLNMSSKEMAQITFQSDEALKKARLRLRQKLDISRETNLVTFLQNI